MSKPRKKVIKRRMRSLDRRPSGADGLVAGRVGEVDDSSFTLVRQHKGLVLVEFWAPWCGPCKALEPLLVELAADAGTELLIVKCNVEKSYMVSRELNVQSVPTLTLFRAGEEVETKVGALTREALVRWLARWV